ncbi:MAG: dihydroorotase [Gaiellales bacterium]|nr:MAG: dihydroorotase [Gaiellales bacterium]
MTATIARRGTRATLVIRDARVLDPAAGVDARTDVYVEKGVITRVGKVGKSAAETVIEAAGRLLVPGFVDLHAHLRTPGREDEEDIASGTAAAAAGGYVTICAMPNTDPVVDREAVLASLIEDAEKDAAVRVAFLGSISLGLQGERLSEMWDLAAAGAVAFTDDGRPVSDSGLLRSAFQAAAMVDLPLSLHCEDLALSAGGVMNEGEVSAQLGLTGWPCSAEAADVARSLEIALYEGGRIHIAHLSCRRSLEAVRSARAAGAAVTCETTPHHLVLTDEAVRGLDTSFKMNPPLRTEDERRALIEALADGAIDCVATDHAPHAPQEKETPFEEAAFGVIGLETAFPVLNTALVETGELPLERLILAMSTSPARIFGLPVPAVTEGEEANLALIDTESEYRIDPSTFRSRSRNSAFTGMAVRGRVELTLAAGRLAYRNGL